MEIDGELDAVIRDATQLKVSHINSNIDWYQRHSRQPRILYQLTGFSVVILGVCMPFVAALNFTGKDIIVSAIALLIAALTGTNSFGQWESKWRGYKQAQMILESASATWELALLRAKQNDNPTEAKEAVFEATRALIEQCNRVVASETEYYFQNISTLARRGSGKQPSPMNL